MESTLSSTSEESFSVESPEVDSRSLGSGTRDSGSCSGTSALRRQQWTSEMSSQRKSVSVYFSASIKSSNVNESMRRGSPKTLRKVHAETTSPRNALSIDSSSFKRGRLAASKANRSSKSSMGYLISFSGIYCQLRLVEGYLLLEPFILFDDDFFRFIFLT